MSFSQKQKVVTGYEYYGSIVQLVCMGPVAKLHYIYDSGEVIWKGPIDSSSADENGRSLLTTSIGPVHFYWGTETQNASQYLSVLKVDGEPVAIPPWRGVCYAVLANVSFGSNTTPPVLTYEFKVAREHLTISAHDIGGDMLVPEVIYDLLVNTVYGCSVAPADIDSASFAAACETNLAEGIAVSVLLDQETSAREVIGSLLSYVDGYLFFKEGQIHFGLNRPLSAEQVAALETVTVADLVEEPEPVNSGMTDTWNRTLVTFVDRDNSWEEGCEAYEDQAHLEIMGRSVPKTFNLPHVKQRSIAKKIAVLIGSRGGLPEVTWTLSLKPDWRAIQQGDHVKLTYPKLGITAKVLRVIEVTVSSHEDPSVKVVAAEVNAMALANAYTPPATADASLPPVLDDEGTEAFELALETPRLATLPSGLKDGKADGWLVALGKGDNYKTGFCYHIAFQSPYTTFDQLGCFSRFPIGGQLVWWRLNGTQTTLRIEFSANESDRLGSLVSKHAILYCATGHRVTREVTDTGDQHQLDALWGKVIWGARCEEVAADIWDITVDFGAYSSPEVICETLTAAAQSPTQAVFFGRESDFCVYRTNDLYFERQQANGENDPDLKRHVKIQFKGLKSLQSVDDSEVAKYEVLNTAMGEDGTLIPDWGLRVPTHAEAVDEGLGDAFYDPTAAQLDNRLIGLDQAVGALFTDNSPEADYTDMADEIDRVVGEKARDRAGTPYNEALAW